jgi:ATP-dependent 26S proteasome regulatory subunit
MTTNKPNYLDKALIRPGRINYNINFENASLDDVKNMLSFYWDEKIDLSDIKSEIDMKYSHAEIIK